jgi:hypothetical protein
MNDDGIENDVNIKMANNQEIKDSTDRKKKTIGPFTRSA